MRATKGAARPTGRPGRRREAAPREPEAAKKAKRAAAPGGGAAAALACGNAATNDEEEDVVAVAPDARPLGGLAVPPDRHLPARQRLLAPARPAEAQRVARDHAREQPLTGCFGPVRSVSRSSRSSHPRSHRRGVLDSGPSRRAGHRRPRRPRRRARCSTIDHDDPAGAVDDFVSLANVVVTIKGRGDRTVPLPAAVPLPAIVHAHHDGKGSFAVNGVDSLGQRTGVLASSLGAYDGTFAVGFVEAANNPTSRLRIITQGPWRLDIGPAGDAPPLGRGLQGAGDTVLSYGGPGATVHLTYRGRARLIVNVYENGGLIPLVNTKGPVRRPDLAHRRALRSSR